MKFEIYKIDFTDFYRHKYHECWYWRLRSRNGHIVADGAESYSTKANVKRAIHRITSAFAIVIDFTSIPVVEVDS